MKFFVSYAKEDRDLAWEVATSLRAAGHDVFFDQVDLPECGEFHDAIARQIEEADGAIVLLSPASLQGDRYVASEIDAIRRRWPNPAGSVFPVVVKDVDLTLVPGYLRAIGVLRPEGSISAAVIRAVRGRSLRPLSRALLRMAACVALVMVAVLWWRYLPAWTAASAAPSPPAADVRDSREVAVVQFETAAPGSTVIGQQINNNPGVELRAAAARLSLRTVWSEAEGSFQSFSADIRRCAANGVSFGNAPIVAAEMQGICDPLLANIDRLTPLLDDLQDKPAQAASNDASRLLQQAKQRITTLRSQSVKLAKLAEQFEVQARSLESAVQARNPALPFLREEYHERVDELHRQRDSTLAEMTKVLNVFDEQLPALSTAIKELSPPEKPAAASTP